MKSKEKWLVIDLVTDQIARIVMAANEVEARSQINPDKEYLGNSVEQVMKLTDNTNQKT